MANRVKYGLKNVHYAVATISSTGSATYGTPKAIPGAVSLSMDPQGETTKFRADNINYWVGTANNGYEGDLEVALVPDTFKVDVLGYVSDSNGVLVEDADAPSVPFALLFEFDGDANKTRHVLYNCTAARAATSGNTTEETIEPQTETMTLSASSVFNASIDKNVVKADCPSTLTAKYNSWFTTVYQSTALTV